MIHVTDHLNLQCTPRKKTAMTVYTQKQDFIESRKYDTEKIFALGSTMVDAHTKRRIEFSETKQNYNQLSQKRTQKESSNPERRQLQFFKKERQIPVSEVIDRTSKYLNSFYPDKIHATDNKINQKNKLKLSNFNKSLRENIIKLIKSIRNKPRDFVTHLNTIFYSAPSVCHQKHSGIENQILLQFRDNVLLAGILKQWFKCLKSFMSEFGSQTFLIFSSIIYEQFCEFMAYLIYDHYKTYFLLEIQVNGKKKETIRQRLQSQTVRYLIVGNKQWETVIENAIFGAEVNKNFPESQTFGLKMKNQLIEQIKNPHLQALLKKQISQNKSIFVETKHSITMFMKESSLRERLKNVLKIRVSLEQDILTYQKKLIESSLTQDFFLLEKDEYLTSIVLSIIVHGINFQKLDLILKKTELMMGEGMESLLRVFKCPSYFNDIIASVDYIQEQAHKDLLKN